MSPLNHNEAGEANLLCIYLRRNVMTHSASVISVMSLSPFLEDHTALEHLFVSGGWDHSRKWLLHASFTLEAAISALQKENLPIIIAESDLRSATWRDLPQQTSVLSDPPLVIVSSQLADEQLWAEALNLGAYNVLAKPFQSDECRHVLEAAWSSWTNRHGAVPERL
jgi:hypothetical protein